MPAIMIQGTGSNVGKSVLVAGLCRVAKRKKISVRPFKPQNMSNNAAVTIDGGEIGRAQALQALACGLEPHTDMNPVLLKPESDRRTAVIVGGKHYKTIEAREYTALKSELLESVLESFAWLEAGADLVIVEGAGSPAEVNLRDGDIANMGFARAAKVPVILAGDIDRGGVIAQMVGTQAVIDPDDEALIKGFIINKFRGDPTLFEDGFRYIEERTGWPGFGVIPYFDQAHRLPAEDALDIAQMSSDGRIKVGVLRFSRIANFDDLDPLAMEPDVEVMMISSGMAVPGNLDLLILPGSKATIADLQMIRAEGWDVDIAAHLRRGGRILGICGGYQMLGATISDPDGIEGQAQTLEGLNLLNVETVMSPEKQLTRVEARHMASGLDVSGYEIHIGRTAGDDCARPFAQVGDRSDGATSPDGLVAGSYLHGLFASDAFRAKFLQDLGAATPSLSYAKAIDDTLEALADHLERHLDVNAILSARL